MESDAAELFEKLPDPSSFKVHFLICTRVLKLVNRISRIFPAIAAACPQCLSGIQELSLLNHAIKQTQQHLQKYSESSKIYLAVTGDAVVSQCQRLKKLLEQCLGQIQTMVQPELATEISHIMDYHGRATFTVDSSEEEAGKAVQRLLQQANSASDSIENSQVRSLQLAASTLHITSPKAILIERQTINKQLDKVGDSDPRETEVLRRLLCLLNKYGNLILQEQLSNDSVQNEGSFTFENGRNNSAYSQSVDVESHTGCGHHEAQVEDILRRAVLPEEQLSNDCVQNEGAFAFENGRNDYAYSQSVDVESRTEEQLSNDSVQNKGEFAFENGRNNSAYSQSVDVESRTGCGHHEAQVDDIPRRAILPEEQLSNDFVQNEGEFAFENGRNNSAHSQSVDVESHTGCGHHEAQVDDILTRAIVPKEQLSNDSVQNVGEFAFEKGRNNSAYSQSVDVESHTRCGHNQAQVDGILKHAILPKEQLNHDCVQIEVAFAFEKLPDPSSFKVHSLVCTELLKFVDRICRILPAIAAARSQYSSGMQELCSLDSAIDKVKLHLQMCSDSSKLYLAVTGDAVVSRSKKLKILLEQRLGEIKTMVQSELAAEISHIMDDLRRATFTLGSSEEEAGKAVRGLLQQDPFESDSMDEVRVLQLAASALNITSSKAILIEKQSIRKQLDKANSDSSKTKLLNFFLYLLKKYGNLILQEQSSNDRVQNEGAFAFESGRKGQHEAQVDIPRRIMPPDEFKCPISSTLMYDPVVIASGQTFERMSIQKWFDEGNDTCPKTKMKLAHLSLTPNTPMKDLILKWCMRNGVTISEPTIVVRHFRETSSSSIDSLFSSENGRCLSNMSLESLDSTYNWDSSNTGIADGLNLIPMQTKHEHEYQSYGNIHEEDLKFLSKLAGLRWESQCEVVENVKKHLDYSEEAYQFMSYENVGEPLVRFLKDARDLHDVKAQKAGSQLLLAFVTKNRSGISYFREETFSLLATVINSELTKEALEILEVLSGHPYCRAKIEASGALMSIPKMLDSNNRDFHELAIKILCNLSSNSDICSHIVSLECIPKLVPLLADGTLAGNCAFVLKNLCNVEEARVSVAETNGCISSIAGLLSASSHEDQENAVAVLLSLCSQRVQYCQLVMDEGVIPALVYISINGNDKGRVSALELLRCLRDVEYDNDRECPGPYIDASRDCTDPSKERKSTKASAFRGVMSAVTKKKK